VILLDSILFEPRRPKSVDFRGRDVVAFKSYLNVDIDDCTPFENSLKDLLDDYCCLVTVYRMSAVSVFDDTLKRDNVNVGHLSRRCDRVLQERTGVWQPVQEDIDVCNLSWDCLPEGHPITNDLERYRYGRDWLGMM
jgi:hypothetical protein